MAFTNAQVMAAIRTLDAKVDTLVASLAATSTPAQASAATSTRSAADAVDAPAKAKVTCNADGHDKVFTLTPDGAATGSGFHATWCKAGFTPAA